MKLRSIWESRVIDHGLIALGLAASLGVTASAFELFTQKSRIKDYLFAHRLTEFNQVNASMRRKVSEIIPDKNRSCDELPNALPLTLRDRCKEAKNDWQLHANP